MWYVYLLESDDKSWHYYGFTKSLKNRIEQHNSGKVSSTKHHLPLKLRYFEAYDSESLARKRESTLKKSRSAVNALKARIDIGA